AGDNVLLLLLLLLLHALDVRERFLGRGYEARPTLLHPPLVLVLLVEALVVGRVAATRVCREDGARLAVLLGRRSAVNVVVLEGGDGGRLALRLRHRQPLEVRVVDGELGVVPLQHPDGRPLDAELADTVAVRLPVRAADNLHVVERLQVADLEQHHRHVVHEQQRVAVAGRVRHQRPVVDDGRAGHDGPGALVHLHDVEQPVGEGRDQHEGQRGRAEQEDARHRGDRLAEEQRPQTNGEQEQAGGQRHQHALALRVARQQLQTLGLRQLEALEGGWEKTDFRQHHHHQRADERHQAQQHRETPLEVPLAGKADPPVVRHLEVADVLHRDALLGRVAGDCRRVIAPRFVLRQDGHLDDLLPVPAILAQVDARLERCHIGTLVVVAARMVVAAVAVRMPRSVRT
uniref:Secreted protein n=1 Tax=Anopheles atroparvus TaxID=41427 RepID=A0AAG5DNN5_ANOAO